MQSGRTASLSRAGTMDRDAEKMRRIVGSMDRDRK